MDEFTEILDFWLSSEKNDVQSVVPPAFWEFGFDILNPQEIMDRLLKVGAEVCRDFD